MKKKLTLVFAAVLSVTCLFSACGKSPVDSSSTDGKPSLDFVGDLQSLYDGEKGYPQAVLVAKTQFIQAYEGWTNTFILSMTENAEWLKTADTQTVVSAVSSHLTEGMSPSFTAKDLSQTVISHCGIRWESAADGKEEVNAFLSKLLDVNESAAAVVSESFYYTPSVTPGEDVGIVSGYPVPDSAEIYMPDGAPALALAKLMHEDEESDGLDYHVVDSKTIQTYVTGGTSKADLCVLPVNLAAKLLGSGENYKMLGVVTHGNLYMLSTESSLQYTTENLSSLLGKTVGVVQLPNVPGLTFKVILDQNNIPWQELSNDSTPVSDKVNLKAIDAASVNPAAGLDCYIVSEPVASAKVGVK